MRALASVVVVALAATLLTACVPDDAPSGDPLTAAELTEAGIAIVDDETAVPELPDAFTITTGQAEWLTTEANSGSGFAGSELDALIPVDAGMPPASYLIASWVTTTDLPGATLAATLFPDDTDFTRAPSLIIPTAAVALFVSDMMQAATDDSFEGDPQGFGPTVDRASLASPAILDGACSAVAGFFRSTIDGIFNVLRVLPTVINGIKELGFFGTVLAGIINGAITLAQDAVEGLILEVVGPVLEIARQVITGLGVATMVVSYFTKERLLVKTAPSINLAFGILPGPGVDGTFTARPQSLTKDWPKLLQDCATALKALPEFIKEGADASWAVTAGAGLITLDSATTKVTSDKTAMAEFVTGTEDAETAKGEALYDASRVSVTIPSKQVGDFVDLVIAQLEDVRSSILSRIPELLRPAVEIVFSKTIDPVIASVRSTLEGAGGILSLKGEGLVFVTHHVPKEPDPPAEPAEPEEPEDSDFCAQFRDRADAARVALESASDLFGWAADFGDALHTISVDPPANLAADFGVVTGFYDLAGQSSFENAGALADYVDANDVDGARVRLFSTCGATEFPQQG